MRRTGFLGALALALAAVSPASGTEWAQIFDIEGDANTVQGTSVSTAPVSYDPADLMEVTLDTDYVAIPVGDDGIRYEPTGVSLRFKTKATARSDATTIMYEVWATIEGCNSKFSGYLAGPHTPSDDPRPGKASWAREISGCDSPAGGTWQPPIYPQGWTTTLDQATGELRVRMPFSSLAGATEAGILKPGQILSELSAWSFFVPCAYGAGSHCSTFHIDHSSEMPPSSDFTIGSDVPEDVRCTRNCP